MPTGDDSPNMYICIDVVYTYLRRRRRRMMMMIIISTIISVFFVHHCHSHSSESDFKNPIIFHTNTSLHCNPSSSSLPNPLSLRSDKLTVVISGYSLSRSPLLSTLAVSYSSHPTVSSVIILWFNSSPPPSSLISILSPSISLHLHSSSSLTARFLPRPQILTRSVLIADDDIQIPSSSLSFAYRISLSHPNSLLGFFARSHDLDLEARSWIYTVHPHRYSIILTKFMILKTEYLYRFSCGDGKGMVEARAFVERERNCEDILMNFVVALESGAGPVLVEGKGLRDWGDPRNNAIIINSNNSNVVEGALSSRGGHRRKRGECIKEFHRLIGEMPLKYSYGKVVEEVGGEQGLCRKGGKLVYCDRDDNYLSYLVKQFH